MTSPSSPGDDTTRPIPSTPAHQPDDADRTERLDQPTVSYPAPPPSNADPGRTSAGAGFPPAEAVVPSAGADVPRTEPGFPPSPPGYGDVAPAYPPQPGYPAPPPGYAPPPGFAPPPGYPPPPNGWSDKSKVVAGVLQIVPGLGIGRFYMGDVQTGVWQLVVTLITCGIGGIWPFIDGILILVNGGVDEHGRRLRDS